MKTLEQNIRLLTIILGLSFFCITISKGQTRTANSDGNWSDSGNWTGGNIGGAVDNNDDVVLNANVDIVIQNGESYTVATLNVGKEGSLTIDEGGSLTITGDMIVDKEFTINANGAFTINNNLTVAKDLVLNVGANGTMDVLGDVDLAKDASLDIQGDMDVTGNFTSAKDAVVNVGSGGTLNVGEDLNLGTGSTITGDGPVTAGDCVGAACTDPQLPITLSAFSGIPINGTIELAWTTESEEDFDYFDVQRSLDGVNYNSIGKVNGHGNSNVRIDYRYNDISPLFGTAYYRLTAIDLDGSFEIFNAINVNYVPDAFSVNIYPNPSNGSMVNINFGVPTDTSIKNIALYDIRGTIIKLPSFLNNNEQIHVDLAKGIYIVKIQIDNHSVTKRLIVK